MTDSNTFSASPGDGLSWELLDRYLSGECSSDEVRTVRALVSATADGEALLRALRESLCGVGESRFDVDARLAELRTLMGDDDVPTASPPISSMGARQLSDGRSLSGRMDGVRRAPRPSVLRIGARIDGVFQRGLAWGIALVAMVGLVFAVSWMGHREPSVTRTYATRTGQRAMFTLSDGTQVTLGPKSILRLTGFGSASRTITLDGDAYFTVRNASGTPFVVRTHGLETRVLGTAFFVHAYRSSKNVHVAVASGRVTVSSLESERSAIVSAGNSAEVNDSTVTVRAADVDGETGWLRDQLIFNHAPMTEVLATLTRWYGYRFRVTDSALVRQEVTVGLSTRSSEKALLALKKVLNVNLTVVGDTITLLPQRSRAGMKTPRAKAYDMWIPPSEVGR